MVGGVYLKGGPDQGKTEMDQASSADDNATNVRIRFKSGSLDDFVARYGSDVSPGGIFIRTREPLAVGTNVRFDLSLSDASPLLVGAGTVVWVREADPTRAGHVPGMGVRFDKLTATSQKTLAALLAAKSKREREGMNASRQGGPALSRPAAAPTPPTPPPPPSPRAAAAEQPKPADRADEAPAQAAPRFPRPAPPPPPPAKAPGPQLPTPAFGIDLLVNEEVALAEGQAGGSLFPPGSAEAQAAGSSSGLPTGGRITGRALPTSSSSESRAALGGSAVRASKPSKAKVVAVILVAAAATAGVGVPFLRTKLAEQASARSPGQIAPSTLTTSPPVATTTAPVPPAAPETTPALAAKGEPPTAAKSEAPAPTVAPSEPLDPSAQPPPAAQGASKVASVTARTQRSARKPGGRAPETTAASEAAGGQEAGGAEAVYWLRLRSSPTGAEVLIDGQAEGKTPFQRRIFDTSRPYAVTVRKEGYEQHEQMVSASDEWVKKGKVHTLTIAATLTKIVDAEPAPKPPEGADPAPPANENPVAPPPAAPPTRPQ